MLGAVPINGAILNREFIVAKAYPDLVAPFLEQYRQQHRAYPSSLEQLPPHPPVPRLLRTQGGSYSSDGFSYYFSLSNPAGFIDYWDYNSGTREWRRSKF